MTRSDDGAIGNDIQATHTPLDFAIFFWESALEG